MFTPLGRKPVSSDAHDGRPPPNRFRLPGTSGLVGLILFIYALGVILGAGFVRTLYFNPARLTDGRLGEFLHGVVTLASYATVHADLSHVLLNLCLAAPFAGLLELRFGTSAMLRIFWGSAVAGVLAHFLAYGGDQSLLGASAGASGLLAAWMRSKLRDGWLFFLVSALWMAANHPMGFGVAESVSWQAHVGGFLAGLSLSPPLPPASSGDGPFQENSSSGR